MERKNTPVGDCTAMTPERLNEIEARHKAATGGKWVVFDKEAQPLEVRTPSAGDIYHKAGICRINRARSAEDANADFIAAAHNTDIPDLIVAVRAAQAEVERLTARNAQLMAENADLGQQLENWTLD